MAAPAGFYPDPDPSAPPGRQRWWDGNAWTATLQSFAAATPPPPPPPVAPPPPAPPAPPHFTQPYAADPNATQPYATQPYATQANNAAQPWAAQAYQQQPYQQQLYPSRPVQQVVNASEDLNRERSMSTPAWLSVLAVGALYAAVVVMQLSHDHGASQVATNFKSNSGFFPDTETLGQLDSNNTLLAVELIFEVLIGLASIPFLRWCYRAATLAQRLHYPAKLSPGLGIGGWFIPICNFWFPYQNVRDMLPPGNPHRRLVRQWWTTHIAFFIVLGVVNVTADSLDTQGNFSLTALLICVAINLVLIVAWVATFRRLQQAIETDHREAIDQINARATSVAQ